MSTDFRALMAQMAAELDHNRRCLLDDATLTHPLADRARYLLAKPADGPAAPPAEGEVAELVAWLRENAEDERQMSRGDNPASLKLDRAAELLERHAVPVPTFRDAIQLAKGCHDYSGGYGGTPCAEAFHAGIGTVVNVLTQAASGSWDHQTKAVFAVGADLPAERHAPMPVPVSERLPGPEDCTAQGWC